MRLKFDDPAAPVEPAPVCKQHAYRLETSGQSAPRSQLEAGDRPRCQSDFIDAILDTADMLIVVFDAQGRLVRYNAACQATTGYDFANFLNSHAWQILVPDEDAPAIQAYLGRLIAGETQVQHENSWLHRDGSRVLINWRNTVLKDESGRVQYVIATGIDVTEQRRAEARARQHMEEISRLQRLQTANELATMLAHELNQPLAAIAGYAEAGLQLLRLEAPAQDKLERNLERISQQSLRAGETIRHMRNFIGRGRIDPVPLDLNAAVESTCTLMAPRARSRGIDVTLDLEPNMPRVLGVDVHIEQILINLLRNAIDAIRDARMKSGSIVVQTRVESGMARVTVADSGPGINAEKAARMFDFLVSEKKYGLGVGLRICRSLIEAHSGRLWVEPHVPGAIIHFVLPFAP